MVYYFIFFLFVNSQKENNSIKVTKKSGETIQDYKEKILLSNKNLGISSYNISIYELAFMLVIFFNDNYEIINDILSNSDYDYNIVIHLINNLLLNFLKDNLEEKNDFFTIINSAIKDPSILQNNPLEFMNNISIIVKQFLQTLNTEEMDEEYKKLLDEEDFIKIFTIVLFKYILFLLHIIELYNMRELDTKDVVELLKEKYKN
ncbi:hypothetical protein AB836_00590 [Rickettsiales bacterium (ex Bugula neritina AB1)]|nr:hypothetical protein AB836_00590 [Rickettsiales bacterium (ex Bugula neritina AB1)]